MLQHFLEVVGLHGFRCLLHIARASQSSTPQSVICHAVLILCLGSFLLEDMLLGSSIGSPGTKIKIFCEHISYLHSMLRRHR